MKKIEKGVALTIQGKDYQVACEPQQVEDLKKAAAFLQTQLEQINRRGKVIGTERAAVLAAINISYEMLQVQAQQKKQQAYEKRLGKLQSEVENIVDQYRQISL